MIRVAPNPLCGELASLNPGELVRFSLHLSDSRSQYRRVEWALQPPSESSAMGSSCSPFLPAEPSAGIIIFYFARSDFRCIRQARFRFSGEGPLRRRREGGGLPVRPTESGGEAKERHPRTAG